MDLSFIGKISLTEIYLAPSFQGFSKVKNGLWIVVALISFFCCFLRTTVFLRWAFETCNTFLAVLRNVYVKRASSVHNFFPKVLSVHLLRVFSNAVILVATTAEAKTRVDRRTAYRAWRVRLLRIFHIIFGYDNMLLLVWGSCCTLYVCFHLLQFITAAPVYLRATIRSTPRLMRFANFGSAEPLSHAGKHSWVVFSGWTNNNSRAELLKKYACVCILYIFIFQHVL